MLKRTKLIALPDGEPPTEVRLFVAGENPTSKGSVIFDAEAAKSVMAAANQHDTDIMLDLEHLSLDAEARNFDPDARGWGKLAVRNGELWLVEIKWNPDGDRRLRERRQRYVSPAFECDTETKRVLNIINVAITALPATDKPMPLVAASKREPKMELGKALRSALALAEDCSDEDMMTALSAKLKRLAEFEAPPPEKKEEEEAASAIAASARRITGKSKPGEVEAVLTALSQTRTQATDNAAEMVTLRAKILRSELREIVHANPKKIASPKTEAYVMQCSSVESAQAYIDTLPEVVVTPVTQRKHEGGAETVTLTDEDREVAKLTGQDPGKVLEFKKKQAAQTSA